MTLVTPNATAPAAPSMAWLDDVRAGVVNPEALRRPVGWQWYDEDVATALETASTCPGRDLVISVHAGVGGASRARLHRVNDARWRSDRHRIRTHSLGTPRDPNRVHVVVLTDIGAGE